MTGLAAVGPNTPGAQDAVDALKTSALVDRCLGNARTGETISRFLDRPAISPQLDAILQGIPSRSIAHPSSSFLISTASRTSETVASSGWTGCAAQYMRLVAPAPQPCMETARLMGKPGIAPCSSQRASSCEGPQPASTSLGTPHALSVLRMASLPMSALPCSRANLLSDFRQLRWGEGPSPLQGIPPQQRSLTTNQVWNWCFSSAHMRHLLSQPCSPTSIYLPVP